jgi:High potential iron-sulfur protein
LTWINAARFESNTVWGGDDSDLLFRRAPGHGPILISEKPMNNAPKIRREKFSRRSILRNLAFTAGGTAVLGTILSGNRLAEAQTKVPQKVVGYQDTPHDGQRCDNCLQFEPPSSCKVVEGNVAAAGWCKVYVKKPA